jgi:hypothetical protein
MQQHHRVIRLVVAFAVGIFLALYSFERISDPEPARQRVREETVVISAREILKFYVPVDGEIEIVDPLAPNRVAGKVYIYPVENGWEVSGYYRRNKSEYWHPFLMSLSENIELLSLSVRDDDEKMIAAAADDPKFSVTQ